jgi:threonyl-tRNA synthetase
MKMINLQLSTVQISLNLPGYSDLKLEDVEQDNQSKKLIMG